METSPTNTLFISDKAWHLIGDRIPRNQDLVTAGFPVMVQVGSVSETDFPNGIAFHKFLDHYWTIYGLGDVLGKSSTERMMFDFIAKSYEFEIEKNRNADCFQTLFLLANIQPGNSVLDFGCGPGLSFLQKEGVNVVGCDVSPSMVQLAQSRGMSTFSPTELKDQVQYYDAAISCYVMHLSIPTEDIGSLIQSIRMGGRLAANFHKGWGVDDFEDVVSSLNAMSLISELSQDHKVHGAIRVWERVQ